MEWIHFMTKLLLGPYFKINGWIYRGILGVLVKKFIKSNFIPFHSFYFREEWKFEVLREQIGMGVLFYPFYSLLLKLPNKGMNFPFPSLKLPNKGRKKYSKIIFFIHFHFIPFSPPKWELKGNSSYKRKERRNKKVSTKTWSKNYSYVKSLF